MRGRRITADRVLEEMRTAQFVTQLPISLKTGRIDHFLTDAGFAHSAREIVASKLASLGEKSDGFSCKEAHIGTLQDWRRALDRIDAALQKGSPPLNER